MMRNACLQWLVFRRDGIETAVTWGQEAPPGLRAQHNIAQCMHARQQMHTGHGNDAQCISAVAEV